MRASRSASRTDLAAAARRFNRSAAIREAGSGAYITLEAPSPSLASRFRNQLGGLGQVVGELWFVTGYEQTQAVVVALWPWLMPETKRRAKEVLGGAIPAKG